MAVTPIKTETPNLPWIEARQDAAIVQQVQSFKVELTERIKVWGRQNGIADLSLQHIMTMAKNPDAKVSHYWNPTKEEWFRYRDGDEVPRWLESLLNRKSYKYPDGSALTSDMLAKFKGRGSGSKKLTSLD